METFSALTLTFAKTLQSSITITSEIRLLELTQQKVDAQTIHGVMRTTDLVKMRMKYVSSLIHVYLEVMVTNHLKMMVQGVSHTTFVQIITSKTGMRLKTVHSSILASCLVKEAKFLQLMVPQDVRHMTSVQTITRKTGIKLKIVFNLILVRLKVMEESRSKLMAPQDVRHTTFVQTITRKTGMKPKLVMIMILANQAVMEDNPFKIALIR